MVGAWAFVALLNLFCNCFLPLQLKTFKIGFYPAAVLPLIIAALVDSSNTVGDITASEEGKE